MIQNSMQQTELPRRQFLKRSSMLLGAGGISLSTTPSSINAADSKPTSTGRIAIGNTVLFQGDSITDTGWNREKGGTPNIQAALGSGYAWFAAAALLTDRPHDGLKIFNRGVSGHKVFQLAERWQRDCLDLKPNVLSILIGVNDIWHTLTGNYRGTVQIYERDYRALLERTTKELPHVKLVICEPFVLKCGAVNEKWFPEFDEYRAAAKRVADQFHATFVPFQSMFDTALQFAPPEHWAMDGVHPSSAGAALMAHHWLKAVNAGT